MRRMVQYACMYIHKYIDAYIYKIYMYTCAEWFNDHEQFCVCTSKSAFIYFNACMRFIRIYTYTYIGR